jgi:1-acyl-sn-glycerol-3-phosphate acyltransferase
LFNAAMIATAVVYSTLAVATFPLDPMTRYRFVRQWARFIVRLLRWTCGLDFRVEGRKNLPGVPSVILSKHQSAWETIAFQEIFPPQVWVLKRELLWLPFFGWGLAMTRPIAIDRAASRRALDAIVRQGIERLEEGRWVVVFPEGTRMAPGQRGNYGPGGALLASRSGAPVVPVAHNAGEFWPRRGWIKLPGTIRVVIGPAIDSQGKSAKEINREAQAWIEGTMEEISSETRGPRSESRPPRALGKREA